METGMSWTYYIWQAVYARRGAATEATEPWLGGPTPVGPHPCILYESQAERDEILGRVSQAGLGKCSKLFIDLTSGEEQGVGRLQLREPVLWSSQVVSGGIQGAGWGRSNNGRQSKTERVEGR